MALDACVKSVLCTLSTPILSALRGTVQAQIAQVQSVLGILQARSLTLGIQLIPIELARDAANAVLQESQSIANLLPLSLIAGCGDLGRVRQNLNAAVEQATSGVNDLADDATRALSLKDETDAQIAELNAQLAEFNELVGTIDDCIAENQA
jgi:hypothetical protein